MELFGSLVIAVAACAAGFAVLWALKGAFLMPVRRRADADVFTIIRASGDAEGLEQTVRGLVWLRDSGRADVCLIIADDGLTGGARRRAESLAASNGVLLCGADRLAEETEEVRWRKSS